MARFILIRHGETNSVGQTLAGRAHVPLNNFGKAQVAGLKRRLSREHLRAVYSSPQERAYETARALADALHQNVQLAAELDELDYGDWTGREIAELQPIPEWQAFNAIRSCTKIPNGEFILDAQARVVGFMERLRRVHENKTLGLVTHADIIRAALAYYLGSPLDLMLRLEISPASLSIIQIENSGPTVLCINNTSGVCG